jgi:hypothetical protein
VFETEVTGVGAGVDGGVELGPITGGRHQLGLCGHWF